MWSSKNPVDQSKGPSKDDLHQWSIYRQNLNAALTSSSSSTVNSAPGAELKPETVSNILSSASFKNDPSDADHFLKFGLPRVKNPIEDQQQALTGRVKNQIKLFNEKTNAVTQNDERFGNRKAIRRLSSNNKQNLSLNDDLDYNLGKEDHRQDQRHDQRQDQRQSSGRTHAKSVGRSGSKSANKNVSKNESSNSSRTSSPNHRHQSKASTNIELPKPLISRLSNHPIDRSGQLPGQLPGQLVKQTSNQPASGYSSLSKQWKSNPNLQDDPYSLGERNKHHSISAHDVSRTSADSTVIQAQLEQLRKCRQFENAQTNGHVSGQPMNAHKSDDDSLTKSLDKSLDKSSPCDELDFRKGSLNDDDLSFEHAKLHKYAKSGLQSSDSEFVLSLDGKSQSTKAKQPHLVVNKIYHEFDSTSNLSLLCGGARQVSGGRTLNNWRLVTEFQ